MKQWLQIMQTTEAVLPTFKEQSKQSKASNCSQ
jgi:hypothetical protein